MIENSCHSGRVEKKLKIALLITTAILVFQLAGSILSNSLALLSDSAHVFMDAFSLFLSAAALKLSARPSSKTRTFGYHRAEIFAAFINGISLLFISFGILYGASQRIINPAPIKAGLMLIFALIGLAGNIITLLLLKKDTAIKDLNIKGAFYHVLGDTLSSLGVILAGLIIKLTDWFLLDPLVSFLIGTFIIYNSLKIIYASLHILLEGVPANISMEAVGSSLLEIEGVEDVHDLHIWSICSNILALSTHLRIKEPMICELRKLLLKANQILKEKFNISHVTIQLEYGGCIEKERVREKK